MTLEKKIRIGVVEQAILHAIKYDTAKGNDPRRRYTPAQMEIALRFAIGPLLHDKAVLERKLGVVASAFDDLKYMLGRLPGATMVVSDQVDEIDAALAQGDTP